MGQISWKQKIQNEVVLQKLKTEETYLKYNKRKETQFFCPHQTPRLNIITKELCYKARRRAEDHKAGPRLSGTTTSRRGRGTD